MTGYGQLFVVVSGAAWVDVEGDRVDVESGRAVVIPRGVRHSKGSELGGTIVMVQMFDLDEGRRGEPERARACVQAVARSGRAAGSR